MKKTKAKQNIKRINKHKMAKETQQGERNSMIKKDTQKNQKIKKQSIAKKQMKNQNDAQNTNDKVDFLFPAPHAHFQG